MHIYLLTSHPSDVSPRVAGAQRFGGVQVGRLEVGRTSELDQVALATPVTTLQSERGGGSYYRNFNLMLLQH